jgi:hypothetical protein
VSFVHLKRYLTAKNTKLNELKTRCPKLHTSEYFLLAENTALEIGANDCAGGYLEIVEITAIAGIFVEQKAFFVRRDTLISETRVRYTEFKGKNS